MNLEFAILAGALTAIYAGMKNIMDTVYVINSKRDLILDIDEDGQRLDKTRKSHILQTDVFPMIVGLSLFLAVYTSAFFLLAVGIQLKWIKEVHEQFAWFLHAAGVASSYALFIVITKNRYSYKIMKAYIQKLPGNDREWNLLPIKADQDETPKKVEETATIKPMHVHTGNELNTNGCDPHLRALSQRLSIACCSLAIRGHVARSARLRRTQKGKE